MTKHRFIAKIINLLKLIEIFYKKINENQNRNTQIKARVKLLNS